MKREPLATVAPDAWLYLFRDGGHVCRVTVDRDSDGDWARGWIEEVPLYRSGRDPAAHERYLQLERVVDDLRQETANVWRERCEKAIKALTPSASERAVAALRALQGDGE